MATPINVQISFESLVDAIASLNLEEKHQLREILEQQIFEAEEQDYADDPETLAELQAVQAEYEAGEYSTLNDYLTQRSKLTS
jgi:hypothetical protein